MNLPYIHVLGSGQDGGVPQLGCDCNNCIKAINNPKLRRQAYSVAIIGENTTLMIDASPDIKTQIRMLDNNEISKINVVEKLPISSIILTHLHYGHYIGILELGREVKSTNQFPIYVTSKVKDFLIQNKPFSYLIEREEIKLRELELDVWIKMDPLFSIKAFNVPHRNEDGDTIGILIKNTQTKAIACTISDIDYLDNSTRKILQNASLVFFDGTFYSKSEIPRQENIPHPPITDTIDEIGTRELGSFYFIHFNHTNPLNLSDVDEIYYLRKNGYLIAYDGIKIPF